MGLGGRMWTAAALAAAMLMAAGPAAAQDPRAARAEQAQQTQVLESLGGAYTGPQADYVAEIGERMATVAGLKGRCTFTLVNSEVVNAFAAPPGCHVYVTRGLLSLLNTEAELAAVLGHEVGHVAADHATRQRNQQMATGVAAALVGALSGSKFVGAVANKAAELGGLSYSRSQEYEADNLSLHYLPLAGYDPEGLTAVLAALQREEAFATELNGGRARAVPAWASTHPLTTDRIRKVQQVAAAGAGDAKLEIGAEPFMARIGGLAYGEDPEAGLVRGTAFVHPRLRIAFQAPAGFRLSNGAQAVGFEGPGGLRGEFAAGRTSSARLADYAAQVLADVAGQTPVRAEPPIRTVINGVDAVVLPARAYARNGVLEVTVAAYAVGEGRAYHFVTVAPEGRGAVFDPLISSFRRLSEREAAAIGVRRLAVVTVKPGDTAESLSARMPGEAPLARFLLLNALERDEPLAPGRKVKVVVDGN